MLEHFQRHRENIGYVTGAQLIHDVDVDIDFAIKATIFMKTPAGLSCTFYLKDDIVPVVVPENHNAHILDGISQRKLIHVCI